MQTKGKSRNIILIVLGIIILVLVILLVVKNCAKKEYVVTFNTNGGSIINALNILKGEKISKLENPTKEGYIFDGWYYEGKLFDFNTKITDDMILEARWVEVGRVTGVTLDLTTLSLKPNSSHTLVASIIPEDAKNQNLKWQSSDESIVTVDKNGKVKALKKGSATITVTTEDGEYSANCKITVTDDIINVTNVTISGSNEVTVGKTIKLTATITPDNASDKGVTWKSSNDKIATVDKNGTVKGLKSGKVTITVTTTDGNKTAKKEITVKDTQTTTPTTPDKDNTDPKPNTPSYVNVTGVSLSGADSVNVGSPSIQLTVKINPDNATNKKYTCTGNNPNVATVTSDCKVTGRDDGEVIVTVTTEDGHYTATHKVTVKSVYSITFTASYNNLHDIDHYILTVYKNGNPWTGFSSIEYNGKTRQFKEDPAPDIIDTSIKEAKIKVDGKVIATASVTYN